jgi:hypothetical protein
MYLEIAGLSAVHTKADEFQLATPHTPEPEFDSVRLFVQDPRPGYALYLPERLIELPEGDILPEWAADTMTISQNDDYETTWPGVEDPVNCFGIAYVTYHDAT